LTSTQAELGIFQFWGKLESLNTLKTNEIAEKAGDNNVVVWTNPFNHSNLKIQRFQSSQRPQRFNRWLNFAPKVKCSRQNERERGSEEREVVVHIDITIAVGWHPARSQIL
jgi:hypothetical protein